MTASWVSAVNSDVYRQFPELFGVKPKMHQQAANFVLIYQAQVQINPDHKIQRIVRAVVDKDGKILKITTSR